MDGTGMTHISAMDRCGSVEWVFGSWNDVSVFVEITCGSGCGEKTSGCGDSRAGCGDRVSGFADLGRDVVDWERDVAAEASDAAAGGRDIVVEGWDGVTLGWDADSEAWGRTTQAWEGRAVGLRLLQCRGGHARCERQPNGTDFTNPQRKRGR